VGAACLLAALAVGTGAAGASAKPVLWLKQFEMARATPGTAASVEVDLGGGCVSAQSATLASNGQPSDGFTMSPASTIAECGSGKLAATISSLVVKSAGGEEVTLTAKGAVHVLVKPWCVYALPKTISLPTSGATDGEGTLTGALDKAATFGSCPTTRTFPLTVRVDETFSGSPFVEEVVE